MFNLVFLGLSFSSSTAAAAEGRSLEASQCQPSLGPGIVRADSVLDPVLSTLRALIHIIVSTILSMRHCCYPSKHRELQILIQDPTAQKCWSQALNPGSLSPVPAFLLLLAVAFSGPRPCARAELDTQSPSRFCLLVCRQTTSLDACHLPTS